MLASFSPRSTLARLVTEHSPVPSTAHLRCPGLHHAYCRFFQKPIFTGKRSNFFWDGGVEGLFLRKSISIIGLGRGGLVLGIDNWNIPDCEFPSFWCTSRSQYNDMSVCMYVSVCMYAWCRMYGCIFICCMYAYCMHAYVPTAAHTWWSRRQPPARAELWCTLLHIWRTYAQRPSKSLLEARAGAPGSHPDPPRWISGWWIVYRLVTRIRTDDAPCSIVSRM